MNIPAISLWQILATAVAKGVKKNETRGWFTDYRGPLAIHAAKRPFIPARESALLIAQATLDGLTAQPIVYGAVLCVVNLVEIVPVEAIRDKLTRRELLYGDYRDHRSAWILEDLVELPRPVYVGGFQQMFHWQVPAEYEALIPAARAPLFDGVQL